MVTKRIMVKGTLKEFWEKHAAAEQYLKTWYETAKQADWRNPNDVKKRTPLPASWLVIESFLTAKAMIVKFNYERQWAFIRFIGTHAEQDKVDEYELVK